MTTPVRIPADVELHDRLLGPLNARQLAILAGAGLLLWVLWLLSGALGVPVAVFLGLATPVAAAVVTVALGRRDGVGLDRLLAAALAQRLAPRHHLRGHAVVHPAPAWATEHAYPLAASAAPPPGQVAPGGPPLPAHDVAALDDLNERPSSSATGGASGAVGVIDLGDDGLAVAAAVSTLSLAMRTPTEAEALVAVLARYLHSLSAPAQILVRAHPVDLGGPVAELHEQATRIAHPGLAEAAYAHAEFLAGLGRADLIQRQVLLVLREAGPPWAGPALDRNPVAAMRARLSRLTGSRTVPGEPVRAPQRGPRRGPRDGPGRDRGEAHAGTGRADAARAARLVRRLGEASALLGPAGLTVTALSTEQARAVLIAACQPDRRLALAGPSRALSAPDDVIRRSPHPVPQPARMPEPAPHLPPNPPPGVLRDPAWGPLDARPPADGHRFGSAGMRGAGDDPERTQPILGSPAPTGGRSQARAPRRGQR